MGFKTKANRAIKISRGREWEKENERERGGESVWESECVRESENEME